jgi:hypothetical protein
MAMGAPICRREHTAVSQPLGWSSRQAATLLEFYQNAFGVLTHWAFERAPVLAGRFGLNASEHHLGAALWAFRTYDSRCWTGRCIHGKPPYFRRPGENIAPRWKGNCSILLTRCPEGYTRQRHAQCRANSYPCPSSARQFDCGARSEAASRHRG